MRHALDGIDNNKVRAHMKKVKFNVPSASHVVGMWERQIRSVRRVMAALLSTVRSQLDDECLHTFLCETAAIIKSRPLSVDNLADPDNYMHIFS